MPKKLYTLDKEGKEILVVSWKGNFRSLELKLHNKPLGVVQSKKELMLGQEFEISHDKILSVKLIKEMYMFNELELLVNGYPVENSMTHPVRKMNDVFLVVMFIAAINLVAGIIGLTGEAEIFSSLGFGFWNIIYAGIFTMLGIIMKESKSMFVMISIIGLIFSLWAFYSITHWSETIRSINRA